MPPSEGGAAGSIPAGSTNKVCAESTHSVLRACRNRTPERAPHQQMRERGGAQAEASDDEPRAAGDPAEPTCRSLTSTNSKGCCSPQIKTPAFAGVLCSLFCWLKEFCHLCLAACSSVLFYQLRLQGFVDCFVGCSERCFVAFWCQTGTFKCATDSVFALIIHCVFAQRLAMRLFSSFGYCHM